MRPGAKGEVRRRERWIIPKTGEEEYHKKIIDHDGSKHHGLCTMHYAVCTMGTMHYALWALCTMGSPGPNMEAEAPFLTASRGKNGAWGEGGELARLEVLFEVVSREVFVEVFEVVHYGLTGVWVHKFKASYLAYFLQYALTDYASRKV